MGPFIMMFPGPVSTNSHNICRSDMLGNPGCMYIALPNSLYESPGFLAKSSRGLYKLFSKVLELFQRFHSNVAPDLV